MCKQEFVEPSSLGVPCALKLPVITLGRKLTCAIIVAKSGIYSWRSLSQHVTNQHNKHGTVSVRPSGECLTQCTWTSTKNLNGRGI